MLFEYGKFWQTITAVIFSWIIFAFFGFEFTCITLLSILVYLKINE